MNAAKLVSLIVPVFNEAEAIGHFLSEVGPHLAAISADGGVAFEIVFVNDGSTDATLSAILRAADGDARIRAIDLSRNFGKEAAMTAGLAEAHGDATIILDVDLQDPPELVAAMVKQWLAGAKVVLARRVDRSEDSASKRMTANWFYALHNRISGIKIPANVGDFRLMDRVVVDAMNQLPENRRFMKGLYAWVGFEPVYVEYKRPARAIGQTKFSGWRLWRFAVEGITSFSSFPLVVWTYLGISIAFGALAYAVFVIAKTLLLGADVPGYASMLVAVLFLGGIQLLGIGVLGEYIGRIYDEAKRRPPYIIASRHGGRREGEAEPSDKLRP